jgi:flagellar motor switch protein FliN
MAHTDGGVVIADEQDGNVQDQLQGRTATDVNLDTLLKVPVSLSIEVGRTRMTINEIMSLREGAVIELERLLEEPLDILVNGALIAHGVVVLANDRFGIQITDIVSQQDRIRML